LDLKQIKQIIDLMRRSELTEFAVEEEGFKLKIRRGANGLPVVTSGRGSASPFAIVTDSVALPVASAAPGTAAPFPPAAASTPITVADPAVAEEDSGVSYIKSPMVGTFYRSPSPESKPFVDPGAKVVENTVVCIIEAMKIMNEIQAEAKGTIIEALVESGQAVEYGQKLFKIKQG
jgi:acetyl-CoA carboxylase biotin carboxyl carrier protein